MPSTYNEHHFLGNGDYVMSSRNTLSARLFAATVDQLRTFGSPGGYPGAPIVPGFGAPQALRGHRHRDQSAARRRRSTANTVNEAVMTFTRNRSDTNGVGHAGRGGGRNDGGRSAVPEAAGDHGAWADGLVPAVRLGPERQSLRDAHVLLGRQLCPGCTASSGCAAAGSSSTSTTAAPTPAARAARSHSRRSRISWSG